MSHKPLGYYQIAWPPPRYAGRWWQRIFGFDGRLLHLVVDNPRKGEYAFDSSTGVYTFSSEDADSDIVLDGNEHVNVAQLLDEKRAEAGKRAMS